MISIIVSCPFCGKESFVNVSYEGYWAWQNGELIQNALPELSANERELLMTGICSDCWESMFGEEEE